MYLPRLNLKLIFWSHYLIRLYNYNITIYIYHFIIIKLNKLNF